MLRLTLAVTCAAILAPAQQFVFDTDPSPAFSQASGASAPVAGTRGWFRARDASSSPGLYVTDGTIAGTQHVFDGFLELKTEFAGKLLLTMVNTSQTGSGLFCTDGTVGGTVQLVPTMGQMTRLGSGNGRLIFSEDLPLVQKRIWSTDLTTGGTFVLGTFSDAPFGANLGNQLLLFGGRAGVPDGIYATDGVSIAPPIALPLSRDLHPDSRMAPELGGHAYFLARYFPGTTVIDELWRTDGTTAALVTTLGPSTYRRIARAGNGLVITGDAGTTTTLFSDGTAAGTAVMTSQVRGFDFVTVGSLAFFGGYEPTHGAELWRTDGTGPGTFLLLDATPGSADSLLTSLTAGANTAYCYVDNQFRLLASDGTVAGTRLLPQSVPPVANSGGLAVLGDTALVLAPGTEMLATDGTSANTVQLTHTVLRPGMQGPFFAAPLLGDLCFVSDDSVHGRELWRTNGTPPGTALVEDIAPGAADAVGELVAVDGELFFGVGGALYRSNGTAAGRSLVFHTGANRIDDLKAGANVVSFRTADTVFTTRLWRSDGATTVASPNLLGPGSQVLQVGDATYYTVVSPTARLYRWQGQPNGGVDLGAASRLLGRLGDRVVFAVGAMLKISDGTVAGTSTIGTLPTSPETAQGNRRDGATFLVIVDIHGAVYATDGGALVSLPLTLASASLMAGGDDLVYMQAADPALGSVLYVTDGSVAGTQQIADFGSLPSSKAVGMWPLGSGNRILMAVQSDTDGVEPWISDGTIAGTTMLADLNPNGSSNPTVLGVAGSSAFFVADDGVAGPELWRLDLAQVGAASVQSLGSGCPGSFGDPHLASGDTPRIGSTFTVKLSQAATNTIALWLIGSQLGELPVGGGCTLYFQSLDATFWNLTDGTGASSAQLTIPNSMVLVGLALIEQVGVFDPLGSSPFGTSTTQGLFWQIGG